MNTATASGKSLAHGPRPDELDLEDHVVAAGELVVDLGAQRPVQVTTVVYPLEELAAPPRRARRPRASRK